MLKYIVKEIIDSNVKEMKKSFELIKSLIPIAFIIGIAYLINYLLGN